MNLIEEAKSGSRTFRMEFPNGIQVQFRLLSWHDFKAYSNLARKGTIPGPVLDAAIYKECVLREIDKDRMSSLPAGIVASVSMIIMAYSGPADLELFEPALNACRERIDEVDSQIIMKICRAFPAYTPEAVEALPWSTVLMRLAQAENILMTKNPPELAEPLKLIRADQRKSGKVNAEDLIAEGQQMDREINSPPAMLPIERVAGRAPGTRQDDIQLTPKQLEQIRHLQMLRERRAKERKG